MIVTYDPNTGRITRVIQARPHRAEYVADGEPFVVDADDSVSDDTHYVSDGAVVPFPERPSRHYDWSWSTKAWEPHLGRAKATRRADVDRAMVAATFAPIGYGGAPFDADATARSRISGTIARLMRGDGLPTGWVGWRDAANQQHWAADSAATVQTHLHALSTAIEDREQALLVEAWTHKASIDALATVEAVLAYDITLGEPS